MNNPVTVWKHSKISADDKSLGFYKCESEEADRLIAAGVAQPLGVGAMAFKHINKVFNADLVIESVEVVAEVEVPEVASEVVAEVEVPEVASEVVAEVEVPEVPKKPSKK